MIIIAVIFAFTVGMKLGMIKGYLLSGGEYMHGGRHGGWMMERGNMMYGSWQSSAPVTPAAPATSPAPSAPTKN